MAFKSGNPFAQKAAASPFAAPAFGKADKGKPAMKKPAKGKGKKPAFMMKGKGKR
jgi:hypothetical protein